MSEEKRKTAPWTAEPFDDSAGYDHMTGGFNITDAEGDLVVTVDQAEFGECPSGQNGTLFPEAERVAKLIAAAPEMAEALKQIPLGGLTPELADKIIAALAKAGVS